MKDKFSTKSVCEIMKACRLYGVTTFESPEFKMSFLPITQVEHTIPKMASTDTSCIRERELITKEQQLAELHLTDPLAYEKMLLNGELENYGNEA